MFESAAVDEGAFAEEEEEFGFGVEWRSGAWGEDCVFDGEETTVGGCDDGRVHVEGMPRAL